MYKTHYHRRSSDPAFKEICEVKLIKSGEAIVLFQTLQACIMFVKI